MRIAVMATGGVGGYIGGLLAKDGHEVHFIARGAHLQAIREHGLHVKSIDDEFRLSPAHATDDPSRIGPVDLVLFAVKTYDTESAARLMQPLIGPDTTVVTFQNGVESVDVIDAVIGPGHVIPAPIRIETFVAAPGRIEQRSPFRVIALGEMNGQITPRLEAVAGLLKKHPLEVTVTREMPRPIWTKMLALASLSGLTSLARTPGYELFRLPEAREALLQSLAETAAVARAHGVEFTPAEMESATNFSIKIRPGITASMHKDVLAGRRLEIDALSGAVVRMGHAKGIPTPVHLTIYAGLKPLDLAAQEKAGAS